MSYVQYEIQYPEGTMKTHGTLDSSGLKLTYKNKTKTYNTNTTEIINTAGAYLEENFTSNVTGLTIPTQNTYCEDNIKVMSSVTTYAKYAIFDTAGTYTFTIPAGVYEVEVCVVGGGGGGGCGCCYSTPSGSSARSYCSGGGGGGSGYCNKLIIATAPGQVATITVGKGGEGGRHYELTSTASTYDYYGTAGNRGGTSSIILNDKTCSAEGGYGGSGKDYYYGTTGAAGGAGGNGGGAGANFSSSHPNSSGYGGNYWVGGEGDDLNHTRNLGQGQPEADRQHHDGYAEFWQNWTTSTADKFLRTNQSDGVPVGGSQEERNMTFIGETFAAGGGGGGAHVYYAFSLSSSGEFKDFKGASGQYTKPWGNGGTGCGGDETTSGAAGKAGAVIIKWAD